MSSLLNRITEAKRVPFHFDKLGVSGNCATKAK